MEKQIKNDIQLEEKQKIISDKKRKRSTEIEHKGKRKKNNDICVGKKEHFDWRVLFANNIEIQKAEEEMCNFLKTIGLFESRNTIISVLKFLIFIKRQEGYDSFRKRYENFNNQEIISTLYKFKNEEFRIYKEHKFVKIKCWKCSTILPVINKVILDNKFININCIFCESPLKVCIKKKNSIYALEPINFLTDQLHESSLRNIIIPKVYRAKKQNKNK